MAILNLSRSISSILNQYAPYEIRSRGKAIFSKRLIRNFSINWEEGKANFTVIGTYDYSVYLRFRAKPDFQLITATCTCPYGGFCKHTVAALLCLKEEDQKVPEPKVKPHKDQETRFLTALKATGKKVEKRTASEPYIIPNMLDISIPDLREHATDYTAEPHRLKEIYWTLKGDTIMVSGTGQDHWRLEQYEIALKLLEEENSLSVTCNCRGQVSKLCGHAFSALYQLLINATTEKNFFSYFTQSGIEDFARQKIEGLGLKFTKNWRKNFDVNFSTEGSRLIPKGKYKGLVNPNELNTELINSMWAWNPGRELSLNGASAEVFHCGFYFRFSDDNLYVEMRPIVGQLDNEGKHLAKKIKPLERLGHKAEIKYEEGEENLVRISESLEKSQYRMGDDEKMARHFNLLQKAGALLETHPRLYLIEENRHYSQSIPKKHLQEIDFHASSPILKIVFHEKEDLIYGTPHIVLDGKSHPLHSEEVQARQYFFVQCNNHLFLHSSLRDADSFNILFNNPVLSSTVAQFPTMVQNLWAKLSQRYALDFSGLKSYRVDTLNEQQMQKELYLSEVGNFVVFKPVSNYGEDQRIETLSDGHPVQLQGDRIIRQQRNRELEKEFIHQLRELHPTFENQNRNDFFYLSYEEFLLDRWFLKVFPKMQEYGIEVMGWKDLKKFNVNPHPAKVSFTFNQKTDWFEAEGEVVFGDSSVSLEELKKQITTDGYIKLDDGSLGVLPEEWLKKFEKMFHHGEVKKNKLKVSTKLFSLVDELFEEIDDQEVRSFIEEKKQKLLNFEQIQAQPLPKGIKATLRHYQEDGYNWLCFLHEFQWGGILADDMGLGKTLQVITFLKHILSKNKQTNLVVVPTSLLFNWENELKKFAPTLKAHFYYGNDRLKDPAEFDKYQIVFTSYGLMTRDIEILRTYNFNYIVLDESQAIKNPASKRYKAARLLQANNRITLTGTPIENNTFDLYAQMSFLNPGLLGSAAGFKKEYAKAIDQKRDADKAADLQKIIKPFVLRRTKEQVATELPDKIEDILYCEMKPAQRKIYDAFRNKYRNMLQKKIEEEGIDKSRFSVLEGLTKLRQICDTPEILSGDKRYESPSAKIDVLLKNIVEKTGNHKILVFSQFVKMLKILEDKISLEGIDYEYLDGKSSIAQRQQSVANFQENENCRVFLISLKAGGTGLNLVAADYVYLVDPWWNPAVENQAIDRCYRIGQDKKVIAYRMICKNTVEEKIVELQNKKKAVASDIISTDENVLKQLGKEDIMELFA